MDRFPSSASLIFPQLVQERDLVNRHRIHAEKETIPPFAASGRVAVKHAGSQRHGHRNYLVGELGEERRESEQVQLPAGGALREHHQLISPLQDLVDQFRIPGPVPREAEGFDGG